MIEPSEECVRRAREIVLAWCSPEPLSKYECLQSRIATALQEAEDEIKRIGRDLMEMIAFKNSLKERVRVLEEALKNLYDYAVNNLHLSHFEGGTPTVIAIAQHLLTEGQKEAGHE